MDIINPENFNLDKTVQIPDFSSVRIDEQNPISENKERGTKIYLGYDEEIQNFVVYKQDLEGKDKARVEREINVLSSIDQTFDNPYAHPNIQRLRAELSDGAILEFGGSSLEKFIRHEEYKNLNSSEKMINDIPYDRELIRNIGLQLFSGLGFVHSKGIIFRDLKPANVTLDNKGNLKIIDFGMAIKKEDQNKGVSGTIAFMSPEQAAAQILDERSDLYNAAALLYEMLTGKTHPEDPISLLLKKDNHFRQINNPNIQDERKHDFEGFSDDMKGALELAGIKANELAEFFIKGLQHNKEKRFSNAEEMTEAFVGCFKI